MTAAVELANTTTRGNSLGSLVRREAAPRGVGSPSRAVLRTQASAVSKPASNWGGVERGGEIRVGQTSEEGRGGEEIRTYAGVLGGRGVVKIVRKPGEAGSKVTADSPVLPVREARAVEALVLKRVIPGSGRLLP